MTLRGSSMRPFLKDGDIVRVYPIERLNKYKVYLYIDPISQLLVTHRLLDLEKGYVCFKGDQTGTFEHVCQDLILAEVKEIYLPELDHWGIVSGRFDRLIGMLSKSIGQFCESNVAPSALEQFHHKIRCRFLDHLCKRARKFF